MIPFTNQVEKELLEKKIPFVIYRPNLKDESTWLIEQINPENFEEKTTFGLEMEDRHFFITKKNIFENKLISNVGVAYSKNITPYLQNSIGEEKKVPFLKIHIEELADLKNREYYCLEIVTQPMSFEKLQKAPYNYVIEAIEVFRRDTHKNYLTLDGYINGFNEILKNTFSKYNQINYFEEFKLNKTEKISKISAGIDLIPKSDINPEIGKKLNNKDRFYQSTVLLPNTDLVEKNILAKTATDADKFRSENPYLTYYNGQKKQGFYAVEGRLKAGAIRKNTTQKLTSSDEKKLPKAPKEIFEGYKNILDSLYKKNVTLPSINQNSSLKKINQRINNDTNIKLPPILTKKR